MGLTTRPQILSQSCFTNTVYCESDDVIALIIMFCFDWVFFLTETLVEPEEITVGCYHHFWFM